VIVDDSQILSVRQKDDESDDSIRRKLGEMLEELERRLGPLRFVVGASRAYRNLYELRNAYRDAVFSIRVGMLIFKGSRKILSYDDILLYRLLYDQLNNPIIQRLYANTVKNVASHDEQRTACLMRTARALVQNNFHVVDTAAELGIHRNTLYQRIDKKSPSSDSRCGSTRAACSCTWPKSWTTSCACSTRIASRGTGKGFPALGFVDRFAVYHG
jgi:sugar diacid utilization regulator